MRLLVVAVGQRLPAWAQTAVDDYVKRFPPDCALDVQPVKAEPRTGGRTREQIVSLERARIEDTLSRHVRKGVRVVALDERGQAVTTARLAERLQGWRDSGDDVAFVIGGADGLDADWRDHVAHERLRLSDLTLPHALARVLLVEQLYRAWSLLAGHPYHRE